MQNLHLTVGSGYISIEELLQADNKICAVRNHPGLHLDIDTSYPSLEMLNKLLPSDPAFAFDPAVYIQAMNR